VIVGLVSVVMPAFDEEVFVGEAIRSVLAQTHEAIELIVVDDGSADRTASIAAGFTGVKVVTRPRRGGQAAARNSRLAEACGEYWTIFDADDVMPRDRLGRSVAHLEENRSVDLVLGAGRGVRLPRRAAPATLESGLGCRALPRAPGDRTRPSIRPRRGRPIRRVAGARFGHAVADAGPARRCPDRQDR
jgi:glycosyltransferase involved in cell wall biosynthesis